jgi:hypothetical protein
MSDKVRIRYWVQETMESGVWHLTSPLPADIAGEIVSAFEQGEIVPESALQEQGE